MQIKIDTHFKNINADEDHMKSDNDRLISFLKKNGMYNVVSASNMIMQKGVLSILANTFGVNPESDINQITLYSNNSDVSTPFQFQLIS